MIGLLIWGAVNSARMVEYVVQARIALMKWLFPPTGLGAAESGVHYGVVGVMTIALAFVSITPELAGAVLGLGGAYLAGCIFTLSQPAALTRAKTGHECHKGCHRLRLFLAEVSR